MDDNIEKDTGRQWRYELYEIGSGCSPIVGYFDCGDEHLSSGLVWNFLKILTYIERLRRPYKRVYFVSTSEVTWHWNLKIAVEKRTNIYGQKQEPDVSRKRRNFKLIFWRNFMARTLSENHERHQDERISLIKIPFSLTFYSGIFSLKKITGKLSVKENSL